MIRRVAVGLRRNRGQDQPAPPAEAPAPPPLPAEPSERQLELQRLVATVPVWFHSIDFGEGVVSPGVKSADLLRAELHALRLPDLTGKTVLDIGAWDGFYTFAAERAGAARVVALDHYAWSLDFTDLPAYVERCREQGLKPQPWDTVPEAWRPHELPGKRGFDLGRSVLGSRAEPLVADFMTTDLEALGTFDVVFYLGVLYHMQDPLRAMRRVAAVTREVAVIETAAVVVQDQEDRALVEFFPEDGLGDDPTNWWAPNETALHGLCRAAGFARVETVIPPPPPELVAVNGPYYRAAVHAWK
jgi:tRNA (mo5U34)-methyltransferase